MSPIDQPPAPATVPPTLVLFQLLTGHYISHALYVAAKLGIADAIARGIEHYEALAKAVGAHAPSLLRLMRLLASAGVVSEREPGAFALTAVGEPLRSDVPGSRRSVALLFAGPMVFRAWGDLLYSIQTGKPAFDHVFGMDAFQYLTEHPGEAALFNEAMTGATTQTALAVTAAYDFSGFRTVVDVGGGHGILLSTILRAHPLLQGILLELPSVAEGARKRIEAAGLADRCSAIGGDFLQSVPAGGDCYILKSVIHDWDDERSITILRNCRQAVSPGGKVLLVEVIVPTQVISSPTCQVITGSDVNMLINTTGRERTQEEYAELIRAAGLRLARIVPTQAVSSVLEAVPA